MGYAQSIAQFYLVGLSDTDTNLFTMVIKYKSSLDYRTTELETEKIK